MRMLYLTTYGVTTAPWNYLTQFSLHIFFPDFKWFLIVLLFSFVSFVINVEKMFVKIGVKHIIMGTYSNKNSINHLPQQDKFVIIHCMMGFLSHFGGLWTVRLTLFCFLKFAIKFRFGSCFPHRNQISLKHSSFKYFRR